MQLAGLTGNETVLDLYCGTGTITLCLARHAKKAIGVEIVPQAIEDAKFNAAQNGMENAEFFCMDAGQAAKMLADRHTRPDVIVVDPPRKGVSADVIEEIGAMAPQRVVYVSCDPATLARDLKLLTAAGYTLQTAEAFDLFPRCAHVETVVLLSRETNPLTVKVRMEVETGEVKEHPTYKRIQEYVQEKYGFKVHTAYIAEVKRMVGLDIMASNYKFSKEEMAAIKVARRETKDKRADARLKALELRAAGMELSEVSQATGFHAAYVSQLVAKYRDHGLEAISGNHYGGNHRNMSFEEEAAILAPFKARAEKGELVEINEIEAAYQQAVGHSIGTSQIYYVLHRHGWRKVMPRSRHPKKASEEVIETSKKLKPPSVN